MTPWADEETARRGAAARDEERALVRRARRGDAAAFERLIDRHQDVVYRLAVRMVGPDEAEDVAQRACLQAWLGLDGFRGGSAFGTWLCRIAANLCLDHLRRVGRFRPLPLAAVDQTLPDDVAVDEAVLARLEAAAQRAALAWALDQLPSEERLLLHWRVGEQRSYQEIAELLGLNVRTVGTRLYRARARLHRLVRRYAEETADGLR